MDILAEIERRNKDGLCISLIYDDNGSYAFCTDGAQNIRESDNTDLVISHFVEAALFRPTIREAWEVFENMNKA